MSTVHRLTEYLRRLTTKARILRELAAQEVNADLRAQDEAEIAKTDLEIAEVQTWLDGQDADRDPRWRNILTHIGGAYNVTSG